MQATSPGQSAELGQLDNGFITKDSLLPAAVLAAVGLLCYAMSLWVFKQKTIGGWAWVLPFLASSGAGVYLYRQQCLSVGVLTNTESVTLARNMSVWVAAAIVIVYSFTQKSIMDGVVALFMGGMMFATILFTGFFIVKTLLLMQDEPDRERGDEISVQDIEKMKAEYRLQRGINEVRHPAATAQLQTSTPSAVIIPVLPHSNYSPTSVPVPWSTLPSVPTPMAAPQTLARPPLAASDEEIRLKIIEVRKQALRAQRRAEMQAKGSAPAPKSVPKA